MVGTIQLSTQPMTDRFVGLEVSINKSDYSHRRRLWFLILGFSVVASMPDSDSGDVGSSPTVPAECAATVAPVT